MARPMLAQGLELAEPAHYHEFAFGIGRPDGMYILRYRVEDFLDMGSTRQDFLHQLYIAPHGMLAVRHGTDFGFVGPGEAFWASRAARHEVWASGPQTVYRVCLREPPPALRDLRCGATALSAEAGEAVVTVCRDDVAQDDGLQARATIVDGVVPLPARGDTTNRSDRGPALRVARELARNPADPRSLQEWAAELHLSGRTLQRDFHRVFGTSFARRRTQFRLEAAKVLLRVDSVATVARRVGYASPSSFVVAFRTAFGQTPGSFSRDT
ncbi:AraC family transcriptional regulator [Pseudonocardia sulfidoxydans NBRC 16205]|uniref:AraC family transcriptional regulator n=1 Tax=Pseudonocardia sulfidoxydans NBRC 16205 TaxID=1223511 RepID=A0A511DJ76_9PSEU|nr:AraC family transcriptional regulator [Pseudonocardia sulfidoxydans]GEL23078.1 AraC family transcriptional regulator [Pseudonocardia sulfidoxydans NBRC 16205]